jgi:hypothetical protein
MRIRALVGPAVVGALLANTPQLALGQTDERSMTENVAVNFSCDECRPDTRIEAGQLGEFLAKNLSVRFGTDMRPLSVRLQLVLISQEEGVIGKWESEAVTIEPGKTYRGVPWIAAPNGRQPYKAPGLGDRGNITLGRFVVINHEEQYSMPRECERATHALWIDVGQGDGLLEKNGRPVFCLNAER